MSRQFPARATEATLAPKAAASQPVFTWWPWRALALAVPLVAVLGGYAAQASESAPPGWDKMKVTLLTAYTIYGAGTGFLLGAAIGDFGRSMLAMIAGAFTALALSPLYDGPGLFLAPLAMICVMMATLALEWTWRGVWNAVWTGFVALFMACLAGGLALGVLLIVGALFAALNYNHEGIILGLISLGLGVGNAVFVGNVFRAAYRVQSSGPV